MNIKHDYSYITGNENKLIENGYGKLSIHSLIFDRYFTEERKEQNRKLAESMNNEQWSKHCDEISKELSISLNEILQVFINKYNIHQVSEETSTTEHYRSDWDLFFYSNRGWNNKDYFDYFTLSFNTKRTPEQNINLLNNIIPILEKMEYENIGCRIQYDAVINEEKIKIKAIEICESLLNKFINYRGMEGKIKVVKEENNIKEYGFFKKNARNRYYQISNADLVAMEI